VRERDRRVRTMRRGERVPQSGERIRPAEDRTASLPDAGWRLSMQAIRGDRSTTLNV
jgi:hypothetical protein